MRKDYRSLEREIRANGYEIVPSGSGHRKIVRPGGGCVGVLPTSSSDVRALKNSRSDLRRAGVIV